MKKISVIVLAIVLVVSLAFGLTACNKKVPVGVQSGTTGQFYVEGNKDWGFEGYSNLECKKYDNAALAVNDLKNGRLSAVIVDEAPAKELVKKISGIKVIDIPLTVEKYAIAVKKTAAGDALKEKINEILASEEFTVKYAEISNKYFTSDAKIEGIQVATEADSNKADKQLVMATNAEFPPFEYKIGDKFAGVDVEMAKYIADVLEMELVILDMGFDSTLTNLQQIQTTDMVLAGLTVNEDRAKVVNFTNSYFNASQMIIVLESDTTFDSCKTTADVEEVLKKLK